MSSVNEMHTELKELIRHKREISIRHLQGYLDGIVLVKKLKYTLDMRKWKANAYMMNMQEIISFKCSDISKLPMPIDLYSAYGKYHYGIYDLIN